MSYVPFLLLPSYYNSLLYNMFNRFLAWETKAVKRNKFDDYLDYYLIIGCKVSKANDFNQVNNRSNELAA